MVPIIIEQDNLSHAWAEAFLQILDNGGEEITPLVLSIGGFEGNIVREDPGIRSTLDRALIELGKPDIAKVAFTIFPQSVWNLAHGDRHRLYKLYGDALPRYVALNRQKNNKGFYFSRLISYWLDPKTGESIPHAPNDVLVGHGNQLEHIITQYNTHHVARRSKFQACIFDPARDHVNQAQLGFPCMQQLTFVPNKNETLTLNAFYATQQLYMKGYGNFLGLCQLGIFMAKEMGLKFERMNCYIGIEKMETFKKTDGASIAVINAARTALKGIQTGVGL